MRHELSSAYQYSSPRIEQIFTLHGEKESSCYA
jgi:hypothetical protein